VKKRKLRNRARWGFGVEKWLHGFLQYRQMVLYDLQTIDLSSTA
jgi:hypothetical protein